MRVGVIGHRGYVGLQAILGTLLDLAPSLGLTLAFEDELYDIAEEGERLLANLADKNILMLRNHGPVVMAKSLQTMFVQQPGSVPQLAYIHSLASSS